MRRRLTDEITALLVISGLKIMLHVPDKAVSAIASFVGGVSYRLSSARRNRARMNLQRILSWMAATGTGDASYRAAASDPKALEALVKAAFRHHALYTFEMARTPRFTEEWVLEQLEVENRDQVNAWLIPNKALIVIGMHFGAIEVPGIFAVHRVGRITSPMETVANARIQRYIHSTRDTVGIHIVSLAQGGPASRRAAQQRSDRAGRRSKYHAGWNRSRTLRRDDQDPVGAGSYCGRNRRAGIRVRRAPHRCRPLSWQGPRVAHA
jgi:lauroyl/myristoyl acyltransferase